MLQLSLCFHKDVERNREHFIYIFRQHNWHLTVFVRVRSVLEIVIDYFSLHVLHLFVKKPIHRKFWGQFCQHVYKQLLCQQIPKAQKDTDDLT